MNVRIVIASLTLALLAGGLGRAAEQPALADFRIVVAFNPQKNEVELKCTAGCAWTELTFTCREGEECSSPLDEYGMADKQ